ncbi:leucine-rich repeat-containing protein 51 isoform X2 [Microcaecilia unicolor]|uniref:Leucine-rich repeat-containing protein 51 n=1 Tax=Microcaecilia unicolor TaxID=1415580 RepID=A0A6P7XXI1_9AMPH|nr:leucine-rich repeat-containing protein 51-like isoform X2 [Microcaecilia unicolor]
MSKKIVLLNEPRPPADFSFKCINNIQDVLLEEPRPGVKVLRRSKEGKLITQSVRLNNNTLTELTNFTQVMERVLKEPSRLSWIDLSFNDLSSIEPVLTVFPNLSVLNLHGNSINRLSEVDKLADVHTLKSLTLHGNPIESEKGYRSYVLSLLPNLKSFDFSGVTKQDRVTAEVWRRMFVKPKRDALHHLDEVQSDMQLQCSDSDSTLSSDSEEERQEQEQLRAMS